MKCRICSNSFLSEFINLGSTPISNDLVDVDELGLEDKEYPLEAFFCDKCYLVQIDKVKSEEKMFKEDYVYFSSTSKSWLKHSEDFAIDSISRFKLNSGSLVIEVASNDGYLLQYYKNKNIPCIGIEPTLSTAKVSSDKGIKTITKFLNLETAKELYDKNLVADLLIGNNVLAHVPDLNNFVSSLKILLKKTGILSLEFPSIIIYSIFL